MYRQIESYLRIDWFFLIMWPTPPTPYPFGRHPNGFSRGAPLTVSVRSPRMRAWTQNRTPMPLTTALSQANA
jgi:hypothetical protein